MGGSQDNINWHDVMVSGTILGWTPRAVYRATLPELMVAIGGQRNRLGIKPAPKPMTHDRLNELQERYG